MSAERVLQAAIVAALRANASYVALVRGGVHDGEALDVDAPGGAEMPYTVIGEATETLDRTHDKDGYQHTVTIHDWSASEGRLECQRIREARNAVLHNAQLVVSGWGLTKLVYEFGEILPEWDEELKAWLRHGVSRYRTYSLEPLS